MIQGKKILLGVTGSIAAYKAALLIRLLKKEGADVQVLMTESACDFITPLTLATLSQRPVITTGFEQSNGEWHSHVEMGLWADLFLIAPVTANTLSKMAAGQADNILIATYLAAKCPVFFAPAMDVDMFHHPSTQANIEKLSSYGNHLIAPAAGELASGLMGEGRMEDPEKIVATLKSWFIQSKDFKDLNVLISAGPTFEAIDPVRFIGNHSSGKMGFSIAEEFNRRGAHVTLVAGPVNQEASGDIDRIDVTSAQEMYEACMSVFADADIIVMSAAVADFTPARVSPVKIKKREATLAIELKPTLDILKEMGQIKKEDQLLVGFALESDNERENANEKLIAKNCDMIVLNSLNEEGAGFGNTNKITIFTAEGEEFGFDMKPKAAVAIDIVNTIAILKISRKQV
ncbi:MAG: bifunctional phosphopantothenoylcysteine decarboxylase/phosphopantothenate--cysteine ligase CoaBC [Bacteroidota bacterium]|nr:bifunctional phosphopantothenoylcysteine decarboxylase/phosphopantothenate--cysteine ligase CoaBC [Bacteroidota bacterium]